MREIGTALAVGAAAVLIGAAWRLGKEKDVDARGSAGAIPEVVAEEGARVIGDRGESWARSITGLLWGPEREEREDPVTRSLLGDEDFAEKIVGALRVPMRRAAILAGAWPFAAGLVLASFCIGLHLRREALIRGRWRSPTLAYLAKKALLYGGMTGILVYAALPLGLPLWLIYPVLLFLCGGLAVYVGSLGRL